MIIIAAISGATAAIIRRRAGMNTAATPRITVVTGKTPGPVMAAGAEPEFRSGLAPFIAMNTPRKSAVQSVWTADFLGRCGTGEVTRASSPFSPTIDATPFMTTNRVIVTAPRDRAAPRHDRRFPAFAARSIDYPGVRRPGFAQGSPHLLRQPRRGLCRSAAFEGCPVTTQE